MKLSTDVSEIAKDQLEKTLAYLQSAESSNLADSDTKLSTDLKILAHSNLEEILCHISHEEKERILAMLDILLNLSQECSDDIASTYSALTSLRDKILSIPVIDQEESEEEIDQEMEATKAQLAKDTTTVSFD